MSPATVEEFYSQAIETIESALRSEVPITGDWLPELEGTRPLHPRFAPYDPVEPLAWEHANPEQYLRRMERLGYVL